MYIGKGVISMQKIVFIDIDGTLRNSKREVTPRVAESVKRAGEKGIQVVLCSARSRKYTKIVKEACGAGSWIIHSNGAEIYKADTQEVLCAKSLPKEACKTLYTIATTHNIGLEMFTKDKIVYINQSFVDMDIKEELTEPIEQFLENNPIVQCVIADENFALMQSLKEEIEAIPEIEVKNRSKSLLYSHMPPKGFIYYNLNAKEASKGNAITILCNHLGIDKENTIAIGDGVNDISMFEAVGEGIAMGNALPIVKQHAHKIIASNDQDGVAQFLDTL